jgi:hypothetical protein
MPERQCTWPASLVSGAVGALTLTAIHEAARRTVPHPPRMDALGRRAIVRGLRTAGRPRPPLPVLQRWALLGDVAANTVYYAAVARGRGRAKWGRALVLGTAAGLGAVLLPPYIGLGRPPNSDHTSTNVMTAAWYLAGALAAAAVARAVEPRAERAAA